MPAPVAPPPAWTTAWPAGLALLLLLAGAWRCRGELRPPRGRPLLPALGLGLLALGVRTLWLPVGRHLYDGHEAEYLAIFQGLRRLSRGGTVLYPAMQWFYRGLGLAFTGEAVPVAVALAFGLGSIALAASLAGELLGRRAAPWAALLLALYGNHAFWSSSAYNVIHPLFFALLLLRALLALERGGPACWAWVAGGAGALVVATRLEAGVVALPALFLAPWRRRPLLPWLLPLGAGLLLAGAAAWPLLHPGGVPGEGERALALAVNLPLLVYLRPWSGPAALLLAGLAWLPRLGLPRRALLALTLWAVADHLLLASFDDYGFRHALPAGVALALLAAGSLGSLRLRWALPLALPLLASLLLDTADVARRYYAPDTAFIASLPAELPRIAPAEREPCTLVAEDPAVAEDPPLSHFNLLDPAEAEALRARTGCLQWCEDLQDWRWSSRAVMDRALRLRSLYELRDEAVLVVPENGYHCLLHRVGRRLRAWEEERPR